MKKLALILGTAASLAFAGAANATVSTVAPVMGTASAQYSGTVTCDASCAFSTDFLFASPAGYTLQSVGIDSNYTASNFAANIDFTSVTLNGVDLNIVTIGQQEFRNLFDQALSVSGDNVLHIAGIAGVDSMGNAAPGAVNATFAGTMSFSPGAVPEPATWAMMLMGFGAVGYGMRRQRRSARKLLQTA